MDTSIVYCKDSPLKATISEWLNRYIGRISVGKRTGKKREVEILAYSDREEDSAALRKYAKEQGALYIRSVPGEGVTAID